MYGAILLRKVVKHWREYMDQKEFFNEDEVIKVIVQKDELNKTDVFEAIIN